MPCSNPSWVQNSELRRREQCVRARVRTTTPLAQASFRNGLTSLECGKSTEAVRVQRWLCDCGLCEDISIQIFYFIWNQSFNSVSPLIIHIYHIVVISEHSIMEWLNLGFHGLRWKLGHGKAWNLRNFINTHLEIFLFHMVIAWESGFQANFTVKKRSHWQQCCESWDRNKATK